MLLLLFVTFVFMASGPTGDWVRLVTVTLQGLTLVAALLAAGTCRRLVRIVLVLVLLAIVSGRVGARHRHQPKRRRGDSS